MRENDRKKRKYIIVGLCVIVLIMIVGFAAFSQQLQINSTSEVASSWDVHIKSGGDNEAIVCYVGNLLVLMMAL